MHANNTVVTAKDMRRGMVILPFWGESTFNKSLDALNWEYTFHKDWWTHIVVGVSDTEVTLARPYAYAHEQFDSNGALLGCEIYRIPKDSIHPHMFLRGGMTL